MKNEMTFLTKEQVEGIDQLDILKKYGTKCAITDFSLCLGGIHYGSYKTIEGETTGVYWLFSTEEGETTLAVDEEGDISGEDTHERYIGGRPALPYSSIKNSAISVTSPISGVKEVIYGEYPQTKVDETLSNELEKNYSKGSIKKTGKTYSTDSVNYDYYGFSFAPRSHDELEYNGKKYIRIIGDYNAMDITYSDGNTIKKGEPFWVAVEPIKWLVDEKANIALSKKILFSGVQFYNGDRYDGNFNNTDIKKFMDKYFSKEIVQGVDLSSPINMTIPPVSKLRKNEYLKHTRCSDFAVALGCDYGQNMTGSWWVQESGRCYGGALRPFIDKTGDENTNSINVSSIGIRPAVPYSSIKGKGTKFGDNTIIYGEYPQLLADKDLQSKLEASLLKGELNRTGKEYTFFRKEYNNFSDVKYVPSIFSEYIYKNKKYVRIRINSDLTDTAKEYLNAKVGDYVWFKVSPVRWVIDEEQDIAISSNILFSGMRYDDDIHLNSSFETSELKSFIDNYLRHDIFSSNMTYSAPTTNNVVEEISKIKRTNPYNFDFSKVSEEDIIRGTVESNVAVFLHGRSSEGKSARVKQLDPDCEIIYMITATPDSLNGKTALNSETGEMIDIPPTWYTKLKDKCEAEPDKIHIVFFEELTNALPSIQGMAFNIVLDGEVNGKWKLPPNARIVAAGNEMEDSLAANPLVQPLFNRFAHVYIETDVDSWLKWASTSEEDYGKINYTGEAKGPKIHPAIYSYIAYKSYSGDDVLRTEYTGEKPNADPRKWEMASKVLTKTNKPEMLRALVGEEITADFVEFVKQQVITVEDVINHNYSNIDLDMDTAQKFATAVGLSSVSEEHIEEVRLFMKKLGEEPRAAFESMWAHGDRKRLEILAELQLADSMNQGGMTL